MCERAGWPSVNFEHRKRRKIPGGVCKGWVTNNRSRKNKCVEVVHVVVATQPRLGL